MAASTEWIRNPDGTPGETWNPVTGRSPVSRGRRERTRHAEQPDNNPILHRDRLAVPPSWRKPRGVLLSSAGDLFRDAVPEEWIDLVMAAVALSPRHRFTLLTKHPRRMLDYLTTVLPAGRAARIADAAQALADENGLRPDPKAFQVVDVGPDAEFGTRWFVKRWPLPNLRIGVSVEDQAAADERIPLLLRAPAAARLLSLEPMLGPIDLRLLDDYAGDPDVATLPCHSGRISLVACGGETGPEAEGMHPDWPRSVRDQCVDAGVPFFFSGWGEWAPGECVDRRTGTVATATLLDGRWQTSREDLAREDGHRDDEPDLYRVGRRAAGHLLDGRAWRELPDDRGRAC